MGRRLLLLAAVVVLGYFLFSLGGLALQGYRLSQRAATVQQDISTLKTENERLRREVERLQTPTAVEALARQQLGLVKSGETAAIVDFGPAGPPRDQPTPTPTAVANWQRWLEALSSP
ncbi:MAG: FtsB family cell division protein [Chloroflexota bacterium]